MRPGSQRSNDRSLADGVAHGEERYQDVCVGGRLNTSIQTAYLVIRLHQRSETSWVAVDVIVCLTGYGAQTCSVSGGHHAPLSGNPPAGSAR